jgi:hypothetical protein
MQVALPGLPMIPHTQDMRSSASNAEHCHGAGPGCKVLQGGSFMATHLRVFPHSHESSVCADRPDPTIHVSLGDLLPLLAQAKRKQFIWLQDFLDDEVAITSDLYDVLCAFSHCRRPSA